MASVCEKSFTLEITGPRLLAYWKFDEAGAGDTRVDSQAGNDLGPSAGGGLSVVAGKIGNGVGFDTLNRELVSLVPSTTLIFDITKGITFIGWVKSTATAFVDGNNLFTLESLDAPINQWFFNFGTGLNNVNFNCSDGTDIDGISKPIVLGTWHFLRAWIDPADKKIRFQLDLGVTSVGTDVFNAFEVATQSQVRMSTNVFGAVQAKQLDEFGVYERVLNDEDAATIYNGGAGNTWPNLPNV